MRHDRLFETGFRRADAIVTVSEWDRQWGLDAGYQPPDRLVAIENPLPASYLGLPLDRAQASKIVLYCGTWLPRKGTELIRSDMPMVLRSYPDWRLQLIGVGDGFDKRDHFPSEVWPQIEVIPQADRETRLRELYRSAAIAIMPSIYDSFGLVAAEAMACGCALAASPVGFAASLRPNVECLWINGREPGALDGALRPLIENEKMRLAIAAAGRERVQGLRWDDACRRLVGLYETWLREKRGE